VHELIEEGLAAASDPTVRARLLWARSATSALWQRKTGSDPIPAEDREADAQAVVRIAREIGDADLESMAEQTLMDSYEERGDYAAMLEGGRRQVELLERISSPTQRAFILLGATEAEFSYAGDMARGEDFARQLYETARGLSPHELMHATASLIRLAYWSGHWEEIPPLLAEHLEALDGEGERACAYMSMGPAYAALVDAASGDQASARERLALVPRTPKLSISSRGVAAVALSQIGEPIEGRRLAEEIRGEVAYHPYWAMGLLEALIELEDWPALEEALPALRARAAADVLFPPLADRAEGLAKLAAGDRAAAERLLRAALAAYDRIGVPFEAARTRERLAGVVEGPERGELLRAALETYERLGATPHAERVQAALRAAVHDAKGPAAT
jgi:hypothetical protein